MRLASVRSLGAITLSFVVVACGKSPTSPVADASSAGSRSHSSSGNHPDGAPPVADAGADAIGVTGHDATTPHDATTGHDAHTTVDAEHPKDVAHLPDVNRGEAPAPMTDFCKLPGSVVWSGGSMSVVPGDAGVPNQPDLTWMKLPNGFCSHYFATVPETRQLRFSPSGDLFVASPSQTASGGAAGGLGQILVLPDDDHDGYADTMLSFIGGAPDAGDASNRLGTLSINQSLLFYDGSFYYQNGPTIWKTPWTTGQRAATGPGVQVIDVTVYMSSDHWAKVLDVDDDGNIYVTNGGDEGDLCEAATPPAMWPFHGGVLRIDGTPNGELIAQGLRNVYAIRCAKGTGMCFGLELARDFAAEWGSREKLFPIRKGDDWGFPCCATANKPYTDYTNPAPNCSTVAAEEDSFIIDHTPFGLDFEQGFWTTSAAAMWKYRAFVVLHGIFGSWAGARIVGIETDTQTGWPVSAAEADGGTAMQDFATGWDDGMMDHGRPAAITFANDGRMFVGNDMNGQIFWIAPVTP